MKKFYVLFLIATFLGLGSCSLIDDLIPDVDTTFSKTFYIDIGSPSGEEGPENINVNDSEDYEDYEDNIDGFEVNDVKFEIRNYNGPDDMYFKGTIMAVSPDGSESVSAGTIDDFLLSGYADDGMEHPVTDVTEGTDQIIDWLDSPGNFDLFVSYQLLDAMGNLYDTEDMNYSLDLKLIYYVTVLTGAK